MPEAVIVATARSPIGRAFKGSLVDLRPDDLAAQMVVAALAKVPGLPLTEIDDLMLGCGLPGGEQGFNMARVVSVLSGLPDTPGTTVNRYCASSLQTIRMAAHAIRAGEGTAFVAAGVECVSRFTKGSSDNLPDTENPAFEEARLRSARRSGAGAPTWTPEPPPDVYIAMGQTAENVAQIENVSREEQDRFALESQSRATRAITNGFAEIDITPVTLPDGTIVATDDGPRPETTLAGLGQLRPVFRPDGTVTAGNSCPLNDGAAAVVIMSSGSPRLLEFDLPQ
jgi:acetyl-CoA C-acetyltransferase